MILHDVSNGKELQEAVGSTGYCKLSFAYKSGNEFLMNKVITRESHHARASEDRPNALKKIDDNLQLHELESKVRGGLGVVLTSDCQTNEVGTYKYNMII